MTFRPAALLVAALLTGCGTGEPSAPTTTPAPPASTDARSGTAPDVLPAARAYVDAVNARDLDALADAFAPDAEVIDVSRTIVGRKAIRAWARAEVIGGRLRVLSVVEQRPNEQKLLVHWAPSGSDGWRAHYEFTIAAGRIATADLQYA